METNITIELHDLTRLYGKQAALDDLSVHQPSSGIVGLLGRNGAGKSTLLRILSGQDLPTSGTARIGEDNPFDNARALSKLCLVPDKPQFGNLRTIKAVLEASAAIYPNWDMDEACTLLQRFDLASGPAASEGLPTRQRFAKMTDKRVKALSRGMQTSLNLVVGLASEAPLTFFDEPSLGLDAVMRERFYDILLEQRQTSGRCFVVSTHLIEEVTRILDNVILIERGKLLAQGPPKALMQEAYSLSGTAPALPQGATCLRTERSESAVTLYCRGARPEQVPEGVTMAPISLQRLFVLLTDPTMVGREMQ